VRCFKCTSFMWISDLVNHSIKHVETVGAADQRARDTVATEEPMEIRLRHWVDGLPQERSITITMRTPGNDVHLAIGFLFTEGIISGRDDVAHAEHCGPANADGLRNVIKVSLNESVEVDVGKLMRNFYTTSSCGVCGKSSLEALAQESHYTIPDNAPVLPASLIHQAPALLRNEQSLFDMTGGIHATGLLDSAGKLLAVYEDVGRHNALDKLIGSALMDEALPLHDCMIMLSGRASFELLQKSMMAGVPVVAAVGAPSSLAIECAKANGITLIGFVREETFNVYSASQRIAFTNN